MTIMCLSAGGWLYVFDDILQPRGWDGGVVSLMDVVMSFNWIGVHV